MRFSVIIPVYNVEKYICICVDSVLKQDFTDYEILLIDDGSPDKSGEICDKYALNYDRISVIHKANGGLSDARNCGLQHAKGDYVIFLDSDDWIEEGCLREFNNIINRDRPDVIETRFIEAYDERNVECDCSFESYLSNGFSKDRALNWCCNLTHNTWPATKKIYSLNFLKMNNIKFMNGRLHEDMDWTSKVLYFAEKYAGCYHPWYYHRMGREGSIMNSIRAKNIMDVIEMASYHYNAFYLNGFDPRIMNRIMVSVYGMLNQIKKVDKKELGKIIKCIEGNKNIFKVAPSIKYKLFTLVMRLLGIKNALYLLSLF